MLSRLIAALVLLTLLAAGAATRAAQAPPEVPGSRERSTGRVWQGRWIWTEGDPAPRNSYTYFRKKLKLDGKPKEPQILITADSRYQLFVNGEFVGRGPVRSDRRWLYYDTWNLDRYLKKGDNVLAVLVHHLGEGTFQYMKGRGGLLAELVAFAGKPLGHTDSTWRALRSPAWSGKGPRMSLQLGFNEVYDARQAPRDWTALDFNDSAWPEAVEIGPAGMEPWPNLVPRDIPKMLETPLRAKRVLETVEVEPPPPAEHVSQFMAAGKRRPLALASVKNPERVLLNGPAGAEVRTAPNAHVSFLIDFGREVTGYPRFRVRNAKGGEIIDMGYGEVLHDERGGILPQSGERIGKLNPDRDGVHYADRYICRPGEQTFQTFDKRGFRYLQIDVRNADAGLELDDVSLLFSSYPVQYRGAFDCSDERLNRIWEVGRWTCQLNMEDGYTDCPWRERAQWWGDARVEALINYYCFGDTALIKNCLRQQGQSLNEEGMIWGVYPTDWDGGRLPSFALIWVSTLWETYQYTGDEAIVRELFPKVRSMLDRFFAPRVGPRGLLKDVPYWVFIDWAPVDDKGELGSLNAYYYDALRSAAKMARLLNDDSAAEYERRAEAVKAALNRELWDAATRAYRDSILPDGKLSAKITQQTNSLCVLFDIAPRAEHARILDYIYAPENRDRVVQTGSPYFSYYQLAALYHAGRDEQALACIRERWGRMLDWGATTWWERWDPGASFCHGCSGGPTYYLPAEVLGVKPLKPGFAEVLVEPQWVGLRYASGVIPLAKGDVKVAWSREETTGAAAVRVQTPEGIPAEIVLPGTGEILFNRKPRQPRDLTELPSAPGTHRYRLERGGEILLELRPK